MTHKTSLTLGVIASGYLLWVVVWGTLGNDLFGARHANWSLALGALLGAMAALRAARHVKRRPYRLFAFLVALALVLLTVSWTTFDPDGLRFNFTWVEGAPSYSSSAYTLCSFFLVCAFGYLALEQWQRRPPSLFTGFIFAFLMFGLAVVFANFYVPEDRAVLDTMSGRLKLASAGMEYLVLVVGLACILLGEPPTITWLLCGTTLMVGAEIGYNADESHAAIEPIWMLGQMLVLAALLVLPEATRVGEEGDSPRSALRSVSVRRSGLSGVLILLSLGGVLLSVAVGLTPVDLVWKSFSSVLFVVVLVVVLVWLTDRFDEAVYYLKDFTTRLHGQRLQIEDWRESDARLRASLQTTGLGGYLDSLRESANRLKDDILFLGPERLFPPPRARGSRRVASCFIAMPFSLEWSNDVHTAIRNVCRSLGVQPMRGDDVFTPTDILDDIWYAINDADFIVADISQRNPNVMYELGIAHALAKPVMIISRSADDIPIDLSTRRIVLYGLTGEGLEVDLEARLRDMMSEILTSYDLTVRLPSSAKETAHASHP